MFNSPTPSLHASENLDVTDHASLMARAKAEASRMRTEAVRDFGNQAFANFWRDANTVWQQMESGIHSATRSTRRLQARMNRRQSHTHSA